MKRVKAITKVKSVPAPIDKQSFNLAPYFLALSPLVLGLIAYIGYRAFLFEIRWIFIAQLSVFLGVLFESFRISEDKLTAFKYFIGVTAASMAFLIIPGDSINTYKLEDHLDLFLFTYLLGYLTCSTLIYESIVIRKLTEGITVFQSVAFMYWIVDIGVLRLKSTFAEVLIIIGFLFSLVSLIHALTLIELSKVQRFILSLWSTIIMLIFSTEYMYNLLINNKKFIVVYDAGSVLHLALQYFLLGVSSMYIMQNIFMFWGLLPMRGNSNNDIKMLVIKHIERYSAGQVSRLHALFCVLLSTTFFSVNFYFNYFARNVAIWTAFVIFPLILNAYCQLNNRIIKRSIES